MSIFNKVISAHAETKTRVEHTAAAEAAARSAAETAFLSDFEKQISEVAAPMFEKFAADAIKHGYPATVEHAQDGKSNPIYTVKLIPEARAKFSINASDQIAYSVTGIIAHQKVEHVSYFDQRRGKNGIKKSTFGVASINVAVLERELTEFLSAALNARAN